jgi:hypothetical protein
MAKRMERRMARFFERGDPAEREQRNLEAQLKAKVDRRVDNAVRLQTAEAKLAEACALVEQLALEGDDAALDRALQARRGAEDKITALRGAALKIGKEIAEIEAAIDKVVDQRVRRETSAAVAAMADELAEAQADFTKAAQRLEAAARQGGLLIPESRAVAEFTLSAYTQLEPATTMVVGALHAHAKAVIAGSAPASLPRPAAPAPVLTVVPQEPTVNLFVTRNIRYVASGGDVICCGQNRRHDLPERIAELALSSGAAVPLTDRARIAAFEGTSGMYVPTPQACEWVGPKGKEPAPLQMRPGPAITHSSLTTFEVHPDYINARPVTGTMPAQPLAVGVRKAEDEQS